MAATLYWGPLVGHWGFTGLTGRLIRAYTWSLLARLTPTSHLRLLIR